MNKFFNRIEFKITLHGGKLNNLMLKYDSPYALATEFE